MKYYVIAPEASGYWGDNSVLADRTMHPLLITKLHYEFDNRPEDVLQSSSPIYIITVDGMKALQAIGATGVSFDDVEITTSELFDEFDEVDPHRGEKLPEFVWLKIHGKASYDDFGEALFQFRKELARPGLHLVVSQRVLDALKPLGLSHAEIKEYNV